MHNISPVQEHNQNILLTVTGTDWDEVKEAINKQAIKVLYKNWKGELDIRNIIPCGPFYWGSTEFHKEEQWLIEVYDLDKAAVRTYAFKDIKYIQD